ncbi:MAG: hypothetical protein IKH01_10995 [Prevotella sp.]|nr:hypothetical protein [Prevotella sp.]
MKQINNKKAYMTPMVEFMNARVEKGFAGSDAPNNPVDQNPDQLTPSGRDDSGNMGFDLD